MSSSHPTTPLCLRKRKQIFLPESFKSHVKSRSSFFLCPPFLPRWCQFSKNISKKSLPCIEINFFIHVCGWTGEIDFLFDDTNRLTAQWFCVCVFDTLWANFLTRLYADNWFLSHMINHWLINQHFVIKFNYFFGLQSKRN